MSKIKRYDAEPLNPVGQSVDESADGLWVYFDDHDAEIARLRGELEKAAAAALANMSLACQKERDADALRVDAMRYRWLRNADNYPNPIGGFWNCLGETSEPEEMDDAIDAAMGADA